MNLTITGNLGSGKSTICKILKSKGYTVISAGQIFRDIAKEKGIDVNTLNSEINENLKKEHNIDTLIDQRTEKAGKELDNVVFDSRLAWHFVPDSFKVFISVDINTAAERVFKDSERKSEKYASIDDAKEHLVKRANMEEIRYHELYGVNYFDKSNYDLIVDSTKRTPEQIADTILAEWKNAQKRQ